MEKGYVEASLNECQYLMVPGRLSNFRTGQNSRHMFAIVWVAVKKLRLSCHNGCIYIYIVFNRASPI